MTDSFVISSGYNNKTLSLRYMQVCRIVYVCNNVCAVLFLWWVMDGLIVISICLKVTFCFYNKNESEFWCAVGLHRCFMVILTFFSFSVYTLLSSTLLLFLFNFHCIKAEWAQPMDVVLRYIWLHYYYYYFYFNFIINYYYYYQVYATKDNNN